MKVETVKKRRKGEREIDKKIESRVLGLSEWDGTWNEVNVFVSNLSRDLAFSAQYSTKL